MDRLTQLQECVDKMSEMFYTSVGVLQRDAPLVATNQELPVTSWTAEQVQANWTGNQELARTVAKDIVETAKVIDFLIAQLPGIATTEEEQVRLLQELEEENRIAGEEMERTVAEADVMLAKVQSALRSAASDFQQHQAQPQ
ncbi:hypothetical protein BC831DRAFT_446234 [Entophlyctis helioformis]|nr:hypothetical protein BC831DRAFT_446234 [Entophlyctis helioformis]